MHTHAKLPHLLLTPGEPAGIGPDLVVKLNRHTFNAKLTIVADMNLLQERAALMGEKQFDIKQISNHETQNSEMPSTQVLHVPIAVPVCAGKLNVKNAPYVLKTLDRAIEWLQQKRAHALVTGPVQKSIINEAGLSFTGHTEYLSAQVGGDPVMVLAAKDMRVALLTTHVPLQQVPHLITRERLKTVIRILNSELKLKFNIVNPRIYVCGLNPHAGEEGYLGMEEQEVIIPTLDELRQEKITLIGPLPADTMFTAENAAHADVVLAMYHDQGLPVIKHARFNHIVNITLGLPIIRTSVDHGTALHIAGTKQVNEESLCSAIELAIEFINNQQLHRS